MTCPAGPSPPEPSSTRTEPAEQLISRQLQRERSAREAALGKRAKAILKGDLGPILKRWVTSAVSPVTARLSEALSAALRGDYSQTSLLLSSGVFGLPQASESRDLKPVLEWFLKGDHGKDLTLAVLGTAISQCAGKHASQGEGVPLTRILAACAQAARETAMGQFITQVQGAEAMMRVRDPKRETWQQRKSMNAVAALLQGPVRSGMRDVGETFEDAKGKEREVKVGGKQVVKVLTQKGDLRMISLRTPEPGDWALLEVARRNKGESDPHASTWMSFAMMVLCAAQAEAGWFDIAEGEKGTDKRGRRTAQTRKHKAAHQLVLSGPAWAAIKKDLDAWMGMGFIYEPMVVPPANGDYLSVKHRPVAGGRGPMGQRTRAEDSAAWSAVSDVMAGTAWSVPGHTLDAIANSEFVRGLALKSCSGDEHLLDTILKAYRHVAGEERIYLPVYMDFRGRVYPKTTLVTYQGNDLQKSLLVFPDEHRWVADFPSSSKIRALAMHLGNLFGNGYDKATLPDRVTWLQGALMYAARKVQQGRWDHPVVVDILTAAKKPLQLLTALGYLGTNHEDRIACQIDGTCNGLQHLSALFRDETAAPYVNLVGNAQPGDIYGTVAGGVRDVLSRGAAPDAEAYHGVPGGPPSVPHGEVWMGRVQSSVRIDRDLLKAPVMVLPYGGTTGTIIEAIHSGILAQEPDPKYWTDGDPVHLPGSPNLYADWLAGDYAAFKNRPLEHHPLLALDAKRLGGVAFEEIGKVIPKAMAAMEVFRVIARHVGDRTLEWDTGFATAGHDSLWVTQAKAVAARSTLKFKGLHLPGSVRGLSIRSGRDEVDKQAHVSGIVANFIHSMDAQHMARTARKFGKASFGANHDCFITRPSLMGELARATREAFVEQYQDDPLAYPVMMYDPVKKEGQTFSSWHALAEHCGVAFPEDGTWNPREVLGSQWFFS